MNFFKNFLASLLAVIVAFGLMIMIWSMIIAGIIASFGSAVPSVPANSVLRLNLGAITDAPASSIYDEFDFMSMTPKTRTTQLSAVTAIQAAAADNRIKGIYINFDEHTNVSLSNLEEIRAELVKFKESGKFILAYNENYSHAGYYLSSVADKVYINPEGSMQWYGLSLQTMFFKGLLDKLDIVPEVIRHGSFKSAVEPFILDKMSPENKLQYQTMANSIWNMIVGAVSEARMISADNLNGWANTLAIDSPTTALEKGLVDGLRYEDEVMAELSRMINIWPVDKIVDEEAALASADDGEALEGGEEAVEEETAAAGEQVEAKKSKRTAVSDPNIVSFGNYASQVATTAKHISRNKIAVIYAEGDIVSGDGSTGQVGSAAILKKLSKVRKDPNVKAVVFRVNSPGGSALASEVMWRELQLLKEEVPVIVSMGSYAASGGYYISCPADVIYASKSTLTGSIGVFGLHANIGKSLKKNLGITVDGVTTNTYSDIGTLYREILPAEKAYIQKSVEDVYTTFVGHVSQGRNMSFEAVDNIGQGRVWTGADAVGIGLVDGIGGIADAIAIAADRAGVAEDFRIWEVGDDYSSIAALLSGFSASVRKSVMIDELGGAFEQYNALKSMLEETGVQARMPYVIDIR